MQSKIPLLIEAQWAGAFSDLIMNTTIEAETIFF
jgi:hypothetical protein